MQVYIENELYRNCIIVSWRQRLIVIGLISEGISRWSRQSAISAIGIVLGDCRELNVAIFYMYMLNVPNCFIRVFVKYSFGEILL